MWRKRQLLDGIGTGVRKSHKAIVRCWDTWGRSNQPTHLPPLSPLFFPFLHRLFIFQFVGMLWKPRWVLTLTLGLIGHSWMSENSLASSESGFDYGCRGNWTQPRFYRGSSQFPWLNSHGKVSKASHKSQRELGLSLKFLFHYCCFQAFPERLQKELLGDVLERLITDAMLVGQHLGWLCGSGSSKEYQWS